CVDGLLLSLLLHLPPVSPLFPYTTLFRSLYRAEQDRYRRGAGRSGGYDRPPALSRPHKSYQCRRHSSIGDTHREGRRWTGGSPRSEEHTSELQSPYDIVCRLLLEKKKNQKAALHVKQRTIHLPIFVCNNPHACRFLRKLGRHGWRVPMANAQQNHQPVADLSAPTS